MIKQIYLAGPYTADSAAALTRNCLIAIDIASKVIALGAYPVTSHALGAFLQDGAGQEPEWWYAATLEQMRRCDAVLMLPGWMGSTGALDERAEAKRLEKPVFEMVAELRGWLNGS